MTTQKPHDRFDHKAEQPKALARLKTCKIWSDVAPKVDIETIDLDNPDTYPKPMDDDTLINLVNEILDALSRVRWIQNKHNKPPQNAIPTIDDLVEFLNTAPSGFDW